MQVVHLHADGVGSDVDAAFIELVLNMAAGVCRIASVRSLGLFSVLFDESATTAQKVIEVVRRAGFDARACRPGPLLRHGSVSAHTPAS